MIGITLVSFVSLFGRSLRNADDATPGSSQVTADYVVTSQNGWDAFPQFAADARSACRASSVISHVRGDRGRVGAANAGINGIDPATIDAWSSRRCRPACGLASLRRRPRRSSRTASPRRTTSGSATTFTFRGPTAVRRGCRGRHLQVAEARLALNASWSRTRRSTAALPRPRDQLRVRSTSPAARATQATRALKRATPPTRSRRSRRVTASRRASRSGCRRC